MRPRTPSYRLHKPSGQAVVTIDGRDFYLGKFETPASRAEYDRLIAEWLQNSRCLPAESDLTINEILVGYLRHCDEYYRRADGSTTWEPGAIRLSVRPLKRLYGHTLAREFGPRKLKVCRDQMVSDGLCRNECNKRTGRIVRVFKWAAENELAPASIWHALRSVDGLRKGRSSARETAPVRPVSDADIEAVLPNVLPPVAAMIRLQRLTGMRPGEVVAMRTGDIDRSDSTCWLYRPGHHKTEHHGHERVIPLGPKAQEILTPWLREDSTAFLFSPREAMEQQAAEKRRTRKTKVQPSQQNRKKRKPRRQPGICYTTHSYTYAIRRACDRAGIPRWHAHQLRHSAATELRRKYGIDAARVVLGHRSPQITETYAQLDVSKAAEIMRQDG